jgi:hypothetical protein
LPQEEVEKIQCVCRKESITLPLKRTVSAKNFVKKGVMTDTISNAHSQFLKETPDCKVSVSTFQKLRPLYW